MPGCEWEVKFLKVGQDWDVYYVNHIVFSEIMFTNLKKKDNVGFGHSMLHAMNDV